jgi:hypothetical protein
MKRVLVVGLSYTGTSIPEVEIENLGLCRPDVSHDRSAFPLYEYDVIVINPKSYTHFLFGRAGEFSDSANELNDLKRQKNDYDFDSAFDAVDRQNEMNAALAAGATVVWCLSQPKRMNFYGYRETHLGYATPVIASLIKRSELLVKKGRRIVRVDQDSPFIRYFDVLARSGWTLCLAEDGEGYTSLASTPEGYSLGGRVSKGAVSGWILTPPSSQEAENQLILDALGAEKVDPGHEKYHGIFLSHTAVDKPFVRRLRDDLLGHGVPRVWVDEAEIEIGDSLISKIEEGMNNTRFIGVVLSTRSIEAPWVKKELDVAMNREIAGDAVVLPLLYEKCLLPGFLQGKLYADFTDPETYEEVLAKLLRRLRIR